MSKGCRAKLVLAWLCTLTAAQELGAHGASRRLQEVSTTRKVKPVFDLVIVIPAHAERDVERRKIQRETWFRYLNADGKCSCSSRTAKVLYVVGEEGSDNARKDLQQEIKDHGDLVVLAGYSQNKYYTSRAQKTRLSIRVAIENFDFGLLLKTDTDSFVFLDRFYAWADKEDMFWDVASDTGLTKYAGNFLGTGMKPNTHKGHKWEDNIYSNRTGLATYPKHAKGAGYALTPDLCRFIADLDAALEPEPMSSLPGKRPKVLDLPSEDVAVGLWLVALDVNHVGMPVSLQMAGCSNQQMVIDHYVSKEQFYERWKRYERTGKPCFSNQTATEPPKSKKKAKSGDTSTAKSWSFDLPTFLSQWWWIVAAFLLLVPCVCFAVFAMDVDMACPCDCNYAALRVNFYLSSCIRRLPILSRLVRKSGDHSPAHIDLSA